MLCVIWTKKSLICIAPKKGNMGTKGFLRNTFNMFNDFDDNKPIVKC